MRKFQFRFLAIIAVFTALYLSGCKLIQGPDPIDLVTIDALKGTWIRVESNNPANDYMKITVNGNTGTITDRANSGFKDGDIKWQQILPSTANTYSYEELGSDYNYYSATITVVSDTELSISVGNSGAGNSQKWLFDDGSIVNTAPTELDCNYFIEDRVLTNTAAPVDYIISCVADITADLVIEPGVVIEIEENGGLGVYDNGSIHALGTESSPIIIRGTSSAKGFWRGIHLETNSTKNKFNYVAIQDAGSNYVYCCNEKASLFVKGGKIEIKNSTISNGKEYGIYSDANANLEGFEANRIESHDKHPMKINIKRAGELDGKGSEYTGNSNNLLLVFGPEMDEQVTIPATKVPYQFEGKVFNITENLTLEKGVDIEMEENAGIGVYDNGSLTINGTAEEPVYITGKEAIKGYWRGIQIESNSLKNSISYTAIADAGGNYVYCCNDKASIFLKDGSLKIQNTSISNGKEYGLVVKNDANLVDFSTVSISDHDKYPVYIAAEKAGQLDGPVSDFSGNNFDYIAIFNSNISAATTWAEMSVPYLVQANTVIDITEPLTIDPGTEIVFGENAGLGVYDNGTFNAVGTASNKIFFRGRESQVGYWRGIHTETTSSTNFIEHAVIEHAGSNYVYCCNPAAGLNVHKGSMTVRNTVFRDIENCAIREAGAASLTEQGNTFINIQGSIICN